MTELVAVGGASSVEPGTTRRVDVRGAAILLCNAGGTLYAIEDVCTHDGAAFDVSTGAVLALPAVRPVRTFVVRVTDGIAYVELPDDQPFADSFPAGDLPPGSPVS